MKLKSAFGWIGIALSTILLLGSLELGSVAYFRWQNGSFLSNRESLELEPGAFVRQDAKEGCSYRDGLFPHPYLGWVHHANPPCGWSKINRVGMYGIASPFKRDPKVFRILLTGGSVAVQLGTMPKNHSLQTLLDQRYGNENLRFEVINAAIEAWKQPQQLIATILYGGEVDGIISLEGFNEFIALTDHSQERLRMDIPWKPSYIGTNPFFEQTGATQIASWVNQRLYEFSGDHWLGSHSKFILLLTGVIRQRFADWAMESQMDWSEMATSLESIFEIDMTEVDSAEQWNLELYKRYLVLMGAVAQSTHNKLAVFIQPVPARFKVLTDQEVLIVGDQSYGPNYQSMEQELLNLSGLPIYSLARLYEDEIESIYTDPIHQEKTGIGYRLMAKEIAGVLGTNWVLDSCCIQTSMHRNHDQGSN